MGSAIITRLFLGLFGLLLVSFPVEAGFRHNEQTGKKDYTGADVQSTDCSGVIQEGRICWDTDNDTLYIGDGTTANAVSSSSSDSFTTIAVPAGASVVAA